MKRYLYIGQENGKEVVIETEIEKPEEFYWDGYGQKQYRAAYKTEMGHYLLHIHTATRIEVISPIPAYWKKGEEVHVTTRYEYHLSGIKGERADGWTWGTKEFCKEYFPDNYRIVAIPIDKAVEPKEKAVFNGKFYEAESDKAVEPEHIADTGKMIEERASGYYWVKYGCQWFIAKWDSEETVWWMQEYHGAMTDNRFNEIDETLITRKTTPNE